MNQLKHYAFYGSLRKGMENHGLYASHFSYIDTVRVSGFRMFSLSEYPYAIRSDKHDSIVVELFEITNAVTEQMICEMEFDVGYILSTVGIENTLFGIFLFENADPMDQYVPHRDWLRYCQG